MLRYIEEHCAQLKNFAPKSCMDNTWQSECAQQGEDPPNFSEKCYCLVAMESLSTPRNRESCSTVSIFMFCIGCMYISACKDSNIIIRKKSIKIDQKFGLFKENLNLQNSFSTTQQ